MDKNAPSKKPRAAAKCWEKEKRELPTQINSLKLLDEAKRTKATERQRQYRARKKILHRIRANSATSNPLQPADCLIDAPRRSAAERQRQYRVRKKVSSASSKPLQPAVNAPAPLSSAERQRQCRARRKILEKIRASSASSNGLQLADAYLVSFDTPSTALEDLATPIKKKDEQICNIPYDNFHSDKNARQCFENKFVDNSFGSTCSICDRLWFENDFKPLLLSDAEILRAAFPNVSICNTCYQSLKRNIVSTLPKFKSTVSLPDEFRRLSLSKLETLDNLLGDFITNRKGLSRFSFNCQSTQNSNVLIISETRLSNKETTDVPNFDCVVKFKRQDFGPLKVALFENANDTYIVTPNVDMKVRRLDSLIVRTQAAGEICAALCVTENSKTIMMVAVYLLPNTSIAKIISFVHETLLAYTIRGAALLGEDLDKIPMIVSGDFNVDFASTESKALVDFLSREFALEMSHPTRSGTDIGAVFSRHLDMLQSRLFVSCFCYHEPAVSFVKCNRIKPVRSVECESAAETAQ